MDVEFIALDVETANADLASICQIGLARYTDKTIAYEWKTYIDPQDDFDPVNTSVHAITEEIICGAPTFPQAASALSPLLADSIVVSHTFFDRTALQQAYAKHGLQLPNCSWLDTSRVVRRAWTDFAWRGYGLENVCRFLGYQFSHHDALEDAKATAFVLFSAMDVTGLDLTAWWERVRKPIDEKPGQVFMKCSGNPNGPLYGEVIVFTGALDIPRRQAASLAADFGCEVTDRVNKDTTILVVGDPRDLRDTTRAQNTGKQKTLF